MARKPVGGKLVAGSVLTVAGEPFQVEQVGPVDQGVCGRTALVRNAILAAVADVSTTGRVYCWDVTAADLSQIERLEVLGQRAQRLSELRAGDFSGLSGLRSLALINHNLTTVPSGLFSGLANLRRLWLADNRVLTALPPRLFSDLSNLEGLYLYNNVLTALPPRFFSDLSNLEWLDLEKNSLSGQIPAELGNLTSLRGLVLSDNQFTGPIPPELGNLASLTLLSIDSDTGLCLATDFPLASAFARLAQERGVAVCGADALDRVVLEALYHATGGPSWTNSTNWLTDAPLSGWFGVVMDGGGRVTLLDLGENGLKGPIPAALGNLANLRRLSLTLNELTGPIPSELGSLTSLVKLNLYGNRLSGPIPPALGELTNLTFLNLQINRLSGPIPAALGNLVRLEYLILSSNELSGPIPAELGNLTNLTELFIDSDTGLCLASDFPLASGFARLAQERGVTVCSTAVPDLIVEPPTVSDDTLTPGQSFTLSATVRNQGSAPSGATTLHYYYVTIPGFTQFVRSSQVASLAAGGASPQSTSLNAPSFADTYLYYACVDGVSGESDTANNCSSSVEVTVTDAAANLMITSNGGGERAMITVPENQREVTTVTASGGTPPYEFQWSSSQTAPDGRLFTMNTATGALAFLTAPDYENPIDSDRDNNYVLTVWVTDASQPIQYDEQTITVTVTDEAEPGAERAVLEALYNATGGPGWMNRTNWLTQAPLSEWFGVETDGSGRVTALRLPGNGLSGTIPAALGNLANLVHLNLSHNQLSGALPVALGRLTRLRGLYLDENRLSGPIPAALGSMAGLQYLDIDTDTGLCLAPDFPLATAFARLAQERGLAVCGVGAGAFTDDPIVAGETPVRAIHFTELRTRIDALRVTHGLGQFPWTDATLAAGVAVRGIHMSELRTALRQAYAAAGRSAGFTTAAVQAGSGIRAQHINELRRAVEALTVTSQPEHQITLTAVRFDRAVRRYENSWQYWVEVSAKNTGTRALDNVHLVVSFYDANGTRVGTVSQIIAHSTWNPGEERTGTGFQWVADSRRQQIAYYRISADDGAANSVDCVGCDRNYTDFPR